MKVEIGNATAIEGYREDEESPLQYRPLTGQRVTTFIIPDDHSVIEAVQIVAATLPAHMEPGTKPVWIESDDPTLQAYLCEHYQISKTSSRPISWGANVSPSQSAAPKKKSVAKKAAAPKQEAPAATEEN